MPRHGSDDPPDLGLSPDAYREGYQTPLEATLAWGRQNGVGDDPRFAAACFLAEHLVPGGSSLAQIAHEWRVLMTELRAAAKPSEESADPTEAVLLEFGRRNA